MNENWKFSDIPYTSPDVEALQTRYGTGKFGQAGDAMLKRDNIVADFLHIRDRAPAWIGRAGLVEQDL